MFIKKFWTYDVHISNDTKERSDRKYHAPTVPAWFNVLLIINSPQFLQGSRTS